MHKCVCVVLPDLISIQSSVWQSSFGPGSLPLPLFLLPSHPSLPFSLSLSFSLCLGLRGPHTKLTLCCWKEPQAAAAATHSAVLWLFEPLLLFLLLLFLLLLFLSLLLLLSFYWRIAVQGWCGYDGAIQPIRSAEEPNETDRSVSPEERGASASDGSDWRHKCLHLYKFLWIN